MFPLPAVIAFVGAPGGAWRRRRSMWRKSVRGDGRVGRARSSGGGIVSLAGMQNIPQDAISFHFIRATGPGGQHVNKTSSAVQLRLNLERAGLPPPVRERLMRLAGRRANRSGEIVIAAARFRSQRQNRKDALARLDALLARAWRRPKPRLASQPTAAAKARRLATKKRHGKKKLLRRAPSAAD